MSESDPMSVAVRILLADLEARLEESWQRSQLRPLPERRQAKPVQEALEQVRLLRTAVGEPKTASSTTPTCGSTAAEITPEMIEAGAYLLRGFQTTTRFEDDWAEEVYRAMAALAPAAVAGEPCPVCRSRKRAEEQSDG